jgi:hypothetical protein
MVTSTESQEVDQTIEVIDPVVPEVEQTEEQPPSDGGETQVAPAEDTPSGDTQVVADEPSATPEDVSRQGPPANVPQINQQTIDELQRRRQEDQQRQWRENVSRKAQSYEQQLQEVGYMPDQARDQARRYVAQEQKFRKQEQDSADMLGYVQGKQAAAVHYMKQHGLANKQMLDDLLALQTANTPQDMEREAKRMKRERELVAENARLKQGRVAPQTFDNSQGSAEATSNQDRLLEAYISGDRSEAAVKAARRLAMGN